MRTTLHLPDDFHLALKRIALERRKTVTDLIKSAIEKVYLSPEKEGESKPFAKLQGAWAGRTHSKEELDALKSVWTPKK